MKKSIFFLLFILGINHLFATKSFNWEGATVYFLITDRFLNGDTTNDINYGRIIDYGSEQLNAATFHGGDFKGIIQKAKEGYFTKLGVDVVWMTDVYEQIHGWMTGSGPINDFPHYGYHGYYPLDYTQIDKNYGTVEVFRELVNLLHSQGIRVMLGANLNNPGYPTLLDAVQYDFAPTNLTELQAAQHIRDWSYDSFFADRHNWTGWYDKSWIRMSDENWDESNPLETTLFGMPDFKDESQQFVTIPKFLKNKWRTEKKSNDPWVNPTARKLRKDQNATPIQYLIAWIASWVEEFGIDGFRCDIVENVHIENWHALNIACNDALNKWRASNPNDIASTWTDKFYMTGDFDCASIDYKKDYAEVGFSSMVNFYFPKHGDLDAIVYTWQAYSDSMALYSNWHPFSYLNNSYHRDADMSNMIDCATSFLLTPGIAQIFYGDETNRQLSDARFNVDSNQAFRSDMNWCDINQSQLLHFQRLGQIRRNNTVIATGRQYTIDNHTCVRYNDTDSIIICLSPNPWQPININGVFRDGTKVIELYSEQTAYVENGKISFPQYQNKIAILKAVE